MRVVADTHALHWYVTASHQLTRQARDVLRAAEVNGDGGIYVSVASRIDLHYLVQAGRMSVALASRLWALTHDPEVNVHAQSVTSEVVEHFSQPSLASLRDPWDRLIAATALVLGVPLVSADRAIQQLAAGIDVIW